jgi:hypothetical protein
MSKQQCRRGKAFIEMNYVLCKRSKISLKQSFNWIRPSRNELWWMIRRQTASTESQGYADVTNNDAINSTQLGERPIIKSQPHAAL